MKASYNLLKKYIVFPNDDLQQLSLEIAEHCFEVEKVEEIREKQYSFNNVFAAKVLTKEKHPNADRLKVVSLDLGGRGVVHPVVCGADNYVPGDIVALALPGAFIPNNIHSDEHEGFVLGSAVIRGVESQGMICSGFELGINDKPEEKPEIIILPKNIKPGTDLKNYLNKKSKIVDYLFEFSLPANRADLHSHIGIARELTGMLDNLKPTAILKKIQSDISAQKISIIKNKKPIDALKLALDTTKAQAYFGARLKVKIAPTDPEMLGILNTLGHTGINNVVDITNFVMSDVGQPMHAYDAEKVSGKICVKEAVGGEEIEALDSKKYKLGKGSLVIADDKNILGIAGIIGGNSSRITESTEEIVLEAALFDAVSIRKTSKIIGLRTDASSLFEKGTTSQQAVYAITSAIGLLKKYADAELLEVNYILKDKNVLKQVESVIKFNSEEINNLLGIKISEAQIKKFLPKMGIKVSGDKKLVAKIPWYRQDISDFAGIADEVVRYIGMNNELRRQSLVISRESLIHNAEESIWNIKDATVNLGYNEIQTYSFLSQKEIIEEKAQPGDYIKISNPLSSETEYLRKNLFTSILKTVKLNAKHSESFKLFEVGFGYRGYLKEDMFLGMTIFNNKQQTELTISKIKGDIIALLENLGVFEYVQFVANTESSIQISCEKEKDLGIIKILESEDLSANIVIASLYCDKITSLRQAKVFKSYGKFPVSSLDISIIVEDSTKWASIESIIKKSGGLLLKNIEIIDAPYLYAKGSLPQFHKMLNDGKKNILFRLIFASEERTLSSSEISEIHAIITKGLENELNAEIR